ncbi:MAG: hypothetical protein IJY39_01480 [Clostridia bacterium]|nr:hypothetical protein [Clostridia bacterium]
MNLTKRITALLLTAVMLVSALSAGIFTASAEDHPYIADGLVALYSGDRNKSSGHDKSSTVWEDLAGDNDLTVTGSKFTDEGLAVPQNVTHKFPAPIVNLVNGQEFTVELYFGDFKAVGLSFNTFLNSTNDAFSLYREVASDQIVFKFASNAGNERPRVNEALSRLNGGLISVTYKVGGQCKVYVNGVLCAEVSSPKVMGANDLFIGHNHPQKLIEATYRSMRFYDRELSAEEIAANAKADGLTVFEPAKTAFVSVKQPQTNISGDIALIRRLDSAAELDQMLAGEALPSTMILSINQQLEILSSDGTAFSTVDEVLKKTDFSVLPVFSVKNGDTVTALTKYLVGINFTDVMIMSVDPALIKQARTTLTSVRGAIDLSEAYGALDALTEEQCLEIRALINANKAYVAVLPASVCHRETVQYLYDRQIPVWVQASDAPTSSERYDALLSGAVGVISDDTDGLLDVAQGLPKNTMTRLPLNIGHRGIVSMAPENTVEGYLLAVEEGADVVEIDIYMTADKQLVVFHDETTGRLWNKDLDVKKSTLAQLQELRLNASAAATYPDYTDCVIPSFKECLEALKDVDCQLFLEIKSSDLSIVPAVRDLVEEYGMTGRCTVISFSQAQIGAVGTEWPEMSCGLLRLETYDNITNNTADEGMVNVMSAIGLVSATYNPQHLTKMLDNVIRAAIIRGITVYPFNFTGSESGYIKHYVWGYSGLTGDNPESMGDLPKELSVTGLDGTFKVGDSVTLSASLINYDGAEEDVSPAAGLAVNVIGGEDLVKLDGNKLTFIGSGEITFTVSYTGKFSSHIVSFSTQTLSLTVEEEETTEEITEETTEQAAVTEEASSEPDGEPEPATGGCRSTLSAGIAILTSLSFGLCIVSRRKKVD